LAMRPFSYHATEDCKVKLAAFSAPAPLQGTSEDKPNPFNALEQLRPSNKH
jgi:hypothetical protein